MTQEDKELLLKDLCSRLPHGVKCNALLKQIDGSLKSIFGTFRGYNNGYATVGQNLVDIETVRPYLRPISSMTEEEKLHVELTYGFFYHDGVLDNVHIFEAGGTYDRDGNYEPPCEYREERHVTIKQVLDFIHWLNAHHFDYRGLIEKGLAIEVTKNNNPYEG